MSEDGRARSAASRWPLLLLAFAGAAAAIGIALLGGGALPAALLIAAGLLVAGFYFSRASGGAILASPGSRADPPPQALPGVVRDVLECLADPIVVLDLAGRVVLANRVAHAIVGTGAERKHISAVLRMPQVLEAVERALAGGEPASVAFSYLVPVERHYQAFIARAQGPGGPDPGLVLIQLHDLTAIRRAEQMRADFVANASHELRTPLAAVSGFIDTLRGHAKDDAGARARFLEIMSVETSRMRRLIDDLLSLTRIELNEHNPPAGETDLVRVVRDAAATLAPLAQADRVTIDIAARDPLPVVGDRDELIQVFQNLIHNAIKYGRTGGRITVTLGRANSQGKREAAGLVFAAVQDEGEGIAREAIPRLTERFYRVDAERSRERGGTGLGLAIVKHILNRHQGRLQIESEPGVGSTFTVFLPAVQLVAAADAAN